MEYTCAFCGKVHNQPPSVREWYLEPDPRWPNTLRRRWRIKCPKGGRGMSESAAVANYREMFTECKAKRKILEAEVERLRSAMIEAHTILLMGERGHATLDDYDRAEWRLRQALEGGSE